MRVYHARWVVPVVAPPIEHAAVAVNEAGRIAYVGSAAGAPTGERVDLGDAALLPGLVNAHTHLELTAMRGFLEELDFVTWIRTLTRARGEVLDDARLLDAARLGVAEGLAAGITTFADTSASGTPMRALVEAGARGIVYQEVFGPAPEQREASMAGLREAVARLRALATPLVRVGVSPHAVFTVHEDLLVDACAFAMREGLPVAMHVSESRQETEFLREASGPFADGLRARGIEVVRRAHSPVHLLVELGVAAVARPLLIHGVTFDASDVHFVAEYGCPVAHCPASNAKLGHGAAPLVELLDAGAVVGLGSDSVASNNRMDILDEARQAVLVQRARTGRHDALDATRALELATLGGARALGLADRVGSLAVGKDADLAAFALDEPRGIAAGDVVATLVYSIAGRRATLVTVAGRELVRDGRVLDADPELPGRVAATTDALRTWAAAQR
ncbi:amidohydrolase [Gemmatirosa kalamazoonensis]|uniref:Amidohydrolase n=1 Tax=Gemmatirosa kalamazoonensis TaxID=861299 RepID=W0RIG0_9BACT|nr:amidohydrolase family protein [Gemmatirosa kalamazoonensis]AHG90130.1 amidohydrolase [Gemmatirosa kalamazoonensis]